MTNDIKNTSATILDLFAAPAPLWDNVAETVDALTCEALAFNVPDMTGNAFERYDALGMAAQNIAARFNNMTLNTALCVIIVSELSEREGHEVPTRAVLIEKLKLIPAFVARNAQDGGDIPLKTFNTCIAGAAVHLYGTAKDKKTFDKAKALHGLGGAGHWGKHKLDKAGYKEALSSHATGSAKRTTPKEPVDPNLPKADQQGSEPTGAAPADMKEENKALAQAAQSASKAVLQRDLAMANLVSDLRGTLTNATMSDALRVSAALELLDQVEATKTPQGAA